MTDMTDCPLCRGHLSRGTVVDTVRVGRRSVQVESKPLMCDTCGEAFYGPGEVVDDLLEAGNDLRRSMGLLVPTEVRALRLRLGLTQVEFEKLLGVGPKTVVRWERGTVCQNRATDTLLRILAECPEAVRVARRRAGCKQPAMVADAPGRGGGDRRLPGRR